MKNKYLLLFFGIFIFMIIPKNVYAETTGADFATRNLNWSYGSTSVSVNLNSSPNLNYLDSTAYFSFGTDVYGLPYTAYLQMSNGDQYSCTLSSVSSSFLAQPSEENMITVSVMCPFYYPAGIRPSSVVFERVNVNASYIKLPQRIMIVKGTYLDTSSITTSQNNTTNAINDNWNNFNNADLDESDKQAPNTDNYNDYQTAENNLFDKMDEADTDSLNVAIDSNSATWVWDRITEWLGTHALLMSFLVSMLSIGIIKMALGR